MFCCLFYFVSLNTLFNFIISLSDAGPQIIFGACYDYNRNLQHNPVVIGTFYIATSPSFTPAKRFFTTWMEPFRIAGKLQMWQAVCTVKATISCIRMERTNCRHCNSQMCGQCKRVVVARNAALPIHKTLVLRTCIQAPHANSRPTKLGSMMLKWNASQDDKYHRWVNKSFITLPMSFVLPGTTWLSREKKMRTAHLRQLRHTIYDTFSDRASSCQ